MINPADALQIWTNVYKNALTELEGAMNRFNLADAFDTDLIDTIIHSINVAKELVEYALQQIKILEEECHLCPV